ncbi:conserved Plasmodium protein, unknown function [Plasmodium yoelii]|nr:conserved Plasmodium protein, unknown function [Plasmodium yoelii]WBY55907.1 hypothetical protein Py17XNL_000600605 [Plasmodium yoelii yoelii]CDU16899.1 conserved Plasmodium protein, unknown function [Plasmodium yoelii]VTZ75172.1 conserved Plasmodium protein, unknown function [Plasmodium yoelii]|eukprot:XP_725720.2 conserved Plasmodium protein, unknown function [Plasmodium yoelii]
MNLEYFEEDDINKLIDSISINYKECNKYDEYIEEELESELENEETVVDNKEGSGKNDVKKEQAKNPIDNIKNAIFQKKNENKHATKNANNLKSRPYHNKNLFTNINVKKKRIKESSDEFSDNDRLSSIKKISNIKKKKMIKK